jgi:MFS family permease
MKPAVQTVLPEEQHKTKVLESIRECLSDKEYVRFLSASLIFHFGWQMGWPLFNLYTISYLHANEMWLTIINVVSSLVMVISFNFWRKLIKKRSFALATSFATLGMSLTPVLYVLSRTLLQNTLMQVATGFFTAGTVIVILGSLLESSPEKNRTMSIALHATLTSATLAISPLIGNAIHSRYSIQVALLVTAGFRVVGFSAFVIRYFAKKRTEMSYQL